MDHEVHINNGGKDARPIIFHLLPGEETIFNLKVINHGPPANLSLQASNPLFKAVRLKKPDHHVTDEEVIPVLARMPFDRGRLDGEIILSAGGRESRVPITLLCDSEDPADDLNDPAILSDGDGGEDIMGEDEDGEREEYEDFHECEDDLRRRQPHLEEDDGDIEKERGKKQRPISFSMDADLERYRSSRGRKRPGGAAKGPEDGAGEEGDEERHFIPRYSTRIDDSFVDKGRRKDQPQSECPEPTATSGQDGVEPGMREDKAAAAEEGRAEEQVWQEEQVSHEEEVRLGYSQFTDIESREIIHQAERDELNLLESVESEEYGQGHGYEGSGDDETENRSSGYALLGRMDDFSLTGLIQAVPVIIFLTLIAALVLTFVTEIVPEFPGALASSILMVTLIIYGTARLLKA